MRVRIDSEVSGILKRYGINRAPVPVDKIALKMNLAIVPTDLGDGVSGALVIKDGNATIGINKTDSLLRRRFTIAHELGHYVLHSSSTNKLFVDTQVLFRTEDGSKGDRQKEREANAFAAALLMPEHILNQELTDARADKSLSSEEDIIWHLARKFKVSEIAMTFRLSNLGLVY